MNITWKIGGEAGFGIMTTGLMFSRLCTRNGYHIFDYPEYPSLIRGGHNVYEVHVGDKEIFSQEKGVDILFALNQETIDLHKSELKENGMIIYDPQNMKADVEKKDSKKIIYYPVPFISLAREAGLKKVMENNIALGVSAAILNVDNQVLNNLITDEFADKGEEIIKQNQEAAKIGYEYVKKNPLNNFKIELSNLNSHSRPDRESYNLDSRLPAQTGFRGNDEGLTSPKMVITGNEAAVLGAISANCKFYAAYPMTPTSAALHLMADWGQKYGVVVKHAEDEISVINMAIGASYAGARSMLGTAGGGFSLMVEALGLAAITETPLVILMGQRPGPATGMPTWTGQGDLRFVIHASQDEASRIVLAPGDVTEMFYLTQEAFNLADRYQLPVFILTDKYIAESHQSVEFFDLNKIKFDQGKLIDLDKLDLTSNYLRYQITDDGISPRALPGTKIPFTANSYEHNEYGFSTEDSKERQAQVDKRNRKLDSYAKTIPEQKIFGEENADMTIVAWGSTKLPVLQALANLKAENYSKKINYLHLTHLYPFPKDQVQKILSKAKNILIIEGNSLSQLGGLIRQETGIEIKNKFLKYDGRPFYPEEIVERVKLMSNV